MPGVPEWILRAPPWLAILLITLLALPAVGAIIGALASYRKASAEAEAREEGAITESWQAAALGQRQAYAALAEENASLRRSLAERTAGEDRWRLIAHGWAEFCHQVRHDMADLVQVANSRLIRAGKPPVEIPKLVYPKMEDILAPRDPPAAS